jgi:hypothetical protein
MEAPMFAIVVICASWHMCSFRINENWCVLCILYINFFLNLLYFRDVMNVYLFFIFLYTILSTHNILGHAWRYEVQPRRVSSTTIIKIMFTLPTIMKWLWLLWTFTCIMFWALMGSRLLLSWYFQRPIYC